MSILIHKLIIESMIAAEDLYHRLVLLVGEIGSGKTGVLDRIADDYGTFIVNVNLELSRELLELTERQRVLRLPEALDKIIETTQSPIILDNLEILFDKELKQDPFRLLQGISRNHTVVASWSGTFSKGRLYYAKTGHPEYRDYDPVDTLIVCIDGTATLDSE